MTPGRIARAAAATALALVAAFTWPAPGRADVPPEVQEELDLLTHDLQALREDVWGGVQLKGYYAFEYHADNRAASPSTFDQHNFNFFVGRNWDRWRVLTEIEFEHGPVVEGDGTVEVKGAVLMEYGWFEYRHDDHLVVRGGKFLLPQYWNVNHYPPVVLSTTTPLVVRAVFPTDTVGLMAHGKLFARTGGAGYTVYYGNGQSEEATDDNQNKAVGGRLVAHLKTLSDHLSRLDVAVSAHSERNADRGGAFDVVGADLQFNTVRYELLFEYATSQSNLDMEGFYVQPSARLVGELRGFYRYDYLDDGMNPQTRHVVGFNWRPRPNVSLKVEGAACDFANPGEEAFDELAASVALFF